MPRVHKHTARTDIYARGFKTENKDLKQGFSIDRSKPRDETDKLLVKKGQEYYKWQFKNSPPQFSLTYPDKRELTRSEFQLAIYDIEDEIDAVSEATAPEDLQAAVDTIKEQIESLRDEQEEKRDNMPESLQDGDVGSLLQERYDTLDNAYNEFDSIDLDYEEPDDDELREEIIENESADVAADRQEGSDATIPDWDTYITEEMLEEKRQEKLDEWMQEKVEEIGSIGLE